MKTPLLIAGCVVLGLGFGIGLAMTQYGVMGDYGNAEISSPGEAHDPPPEAYIQSDTYDFGSMEIESSLEHTFVITNRGGSDLTLRRGNTTCKCTMSRLNEERIPPGESTEIHLEWKAETLSPRFRQTATIHTNDPQRKEITLTVEGDILRSLTAYPNEQIVFSSLHHGVAESKHVDLYAPLMDGLEVTGYTLSRPELGEHIDISFAPIAADELDTEHGQSAVRVTATIVPEANLGNFRTVLSLDTNHPERPVFGVDLRGNVDRGISIFGKGWKKEFELLDLRTVSRSSGLDRTLTLWLRGPAREDTRLEIVSCEPEFVEATLGEPQPSSNGSAIRVPLDIVIPPGTEPTIRLGNEGGGYGLVLIETHNKELGQIRIPLRFAVK